MGWDPGSPHPPEHDEADEADEAEKPAADVVADEGIDKPDSTPETAPGAES